MKHSPERDDSIHDVEQQLSVLWRRSRAISNRLSSEIHPDLDPAAYSLLSVVRRERSIRMTDLAAFLGIGKPSISRQVTTLISLGILERTVDPADRRSQQITLTDEGETIMRRVQDARRQAFHSYLEQWTLEDLHNLADGLERLNEIYANSPLSER